MKPIANTVDDLFQPRELAEDESIVPNAIHLDSTELN